MRYSLNSPFPIPRARDAAGPLTAVKDDAVISVTMDEKKRTYNRPLAYIVRVYIYSYARSSFFGL